MHKLACLYMSVAGYGVKICATYHRSSKQRNLVTTSIHLSTATLPPASRRARRAVDAAVQQAGSRRRAAAGHAAALRCAGNSCLVFKIAQADGAPPTSRAASASTSAQPQCACHGE